MDAPIPFPPAPTDVTPAAPSMTITLSPDLQSVTVNGPIDNRLLAFGMLEMAREALLSYNARKSQSRIVPASALPPEFANGKN